MIKTVLMSAKQGGKNIAIQKVIDAHIKKNPDAVIVKVIRGETIIEKPVKGTHK